ncbi:unnamed protein product [Microthlaspi erraticum]|uniref:Uncharacterized protein n=1 Tax=Microthlaspi erraticum TaxID=1685480 RepID=A0A6D2KHX6_9BRAS|nr:unnamed protein product [Microthlaspi erraticum]
MHVLDQLHILKDSKGLMCHHVGTWSPQSPWRREHCSALGTWGAHPPLALLSLFHWLILVPSCHLHQPIDSPLLLPLHSQFITPSSLESHFPLLNKVHSNLKLPLLTLTTNGSFLFLVLLSSLNSHSQTVLRVDISSASDFHLFDHPLQIGLHLKPSFSCIA